MGYADEIISRHAEISQSGGLLPLLDLPTFDTYAVYNLRSGIGKTALVFNLSYLIDNALMVDTNPQGDLSYLYDSAYFSGPGVSVYDMILPHIVPGLGAAKFVAKRIAATNDYFKGKNNYYIPASHYLYILPSQMSIALQQAQTLPGAQRAASMDNILYALKNELKREQADTKTTKCLIDTAPFFSGGTHLVWYATDALIVPVSPDPRSIKSLNLLFALMSSPGSEFRRYPTSDQPPQDSADCIDALRLVYPQGRTA